MQHLIAARSFCLATLSSLMRERHTMSKTLQVSVTLHGATCRTLHRPQLVALHSLTHCIAGGHWGRLLLGQHVLLPCYHGGHAEAAGPQC